MIQYDESIKKVIIVIVIAIIDSKKLSVVSELKS